MGGIVGVWNLDGQAVEQALLARLSATLAHRGPDGEGVWIHGPVGFACRHLRVTPEAVEERQPVVGPSGTVVVFDGRLDNREELLASLRPSLGVTRLSTDPELVLAAYEAYGEPFIERLSGDFALGLFDASRQRLLLGRDAIGIRPLYYHRAQHLVVFASEVKAILAHPRISPRPNDDVLADFLLDGPRDTGGMTFFRDVCSVLPAHMAILDTQGQVTRQYWDFDLSRRTRLGSFEEYAAAFRQHFEEAVRRRIRSTHPVAVSVSGGLDSSSIFCLAETLARRSPGRYPAVLGASYLSPEGSPSDEQAFLIEIEREYGVAIQRVPVSPMGPMNGSREAVWHIETPFLDEQWETTHALLRTVRDRGARVLLTGHWADQVLFDQAYLVDLFRRLAWREVWSHLKEFGRWLTDTDPTYFRQRFSLDLVKYHLPQALLPWVRRLRSGRHRPWYAEGLRKRVRQRRSRPTATRGGFLSAHARSLYEQARSGHHVQCMEWDNKVAAMHGLEMAFPFLDRDLLSFLMGIPGEMQTWQGVPKALLRTAMRDVLPDAIARRTWKADFSHLVNERMARDFPRLARRLESDGLALRLGYLDGAALRGELWQMKDQIRGPGCEISWDLSDLLGLEVWLQVFLGGTTRGTEEMGFSECRMRAAEQGDAQ